MYSFCLLILCAVNISFRYNLLGTYVNSPKNIKSIQRSNYIFAVCSFNMFLGECWHSTDLDCKNVKI